MAFPLNFRSEKYIYKQHRPAAFHSDVSFPRIYYCTMYIPLLFEYVYIYLHAPFTALSDLNDAGNIESTAGLLSTFGFYVYICDLRGKMEDENVPIIVMQRVSLYFA